MEILRLGNELLCQKARPVQTIGPEYPAVAAAMFEALHAEKGLGLAGPQVGRMERIFAVHVDGDVPRFFINPSIIETSREIVKYEEGCLSIPGLYADVMRPSAIKVQAWNENGKPFTLEVSGILARVILHELDHLEGVLFIDRIPEHKRERLLTKFSKMLRAGKKQR